eukprot:TRINITY_DN15529_c0_g3_i1.p1 TRINITY_DN15529_c0_g3~~TRINITY_DN15529_c0_g3_i1.p1  ORF type:complete len:135 (-),score=24.59 TRINITY_DN15529_c0_g3_i1:13-417(-)
MGALFIALKLDGVFKVPMAVALIPFFLIDAFCCCIFLVGGLLGLCFFCFVIGPFLAFEIMLAVRNWDVAAKQLPINKLFIPLYVGYSVWILLGLLMVLGAMFEARLSATSPTLPRDDTVAHHFLFESEHSEEIP